MFRDDVAGRGFMPPYLASASFPQPFVYAKADDDEEKQPPFEKSSRGSLSFILLVDWHDPLSCAPPSGKENKRSQTRARRLSMALDRSSSALKPFFYYVTVCPIDGLESFCLPRGVAGAETDKSPICFVVVVRLDNRTEERKVFQIFSMKKSSRCALLLLLLSCDCERGIGGVKSSLHKQART